jgi:hypothetical protein
VIGAEVVPQQGMIAFVDDGSIPFDQAEDGQCIVRIQRVGTWLLVEDNQQCGGSMATFTGLYRRNQPGGTARRNQDEGAPCVTTFAAVNCLATTPTMQAIF